MWGAFKGISMWRLPKKFRKETKDNNKKNTKRLLSRANIRI